MELSKNYIPGQVEQKWYSHWKSKGYFESKPDNRKPFTIVIPPPNVTGVLHMGHTLNETVQDILIRKARMSGFNACWVPGSDHASIATEAKVVAMLKENGIDKNNLSREEFLKYAFEWKEKYGDIIYNQIERLGCGVDWGRVTFTMDDHYYKAVIKVFVDLYNKGLIYRGARMINWDPAAKTALSDEEVEYKEVTGKLYYIKYFVVSSEMSEVSNEDTHNSQLTTDFIVIATQRPETIMGDTAVCANPADKRYFHLKGKSVLIPLINKKVPVIFDDYVDQDFGTGILKITPAHDINDAELGMKYNLPFINILNDDGTLNYHAKIYIGEDRFEARKKIVNELEKNDHLIKVEEYETRLGYSQRTGVVVEPTISEQWFVKMKEIAQPALETVSSGRIKIHPGEKFLATYKNWLENVKDWCISRQLWWGQRIPAWYGLKDPAFSMDDAINKDLSKWQPFVAENENDARIKFREYYTDLGLNERQIEGLFKDYFKRDEDVLDTWFSSWLWPMEVFKGITKPGNEDIEYYYPTSVLVTGQDIIFFWVARMIMAGMEYRKEKPFSDVYFTGMVRDKQGRKMSKQLGNSPDLLELIENYGADAVRFGIMISSPAGNDLLFDEASLEQGRNFNNKIWNALKLVKIWEGRKLTLSEDEIESGNFACLWFGNRLKEVRAEVDVLMKQFRLSEALKTVYSLIWDDFCSWYLEWVKPGFEQGISANIYNKTINFFEDLLQLLHPFMPFITEEIYHLLKEQKDDLTIKQFKETDTIDKSILQHGTILKEAITTIRDAKNTNQVKPKQKIRLYIQSSNPQMYKGIGQILSKQINAESVEFTTDIPANSLTVIMNKDKFYIKTGQLIEHSLQREQLMKHLEYLKGFLNSVNLKLNNEKFVQNAKAEVIELERKKKADAEIKIQVIEESLSALS